MSQSWTWPGARWWRVDLHAHSPASHDFKIQDDQEDNKWALWIKAAGASLEAVAVTDHNTATGIDELQQAAGDVEDAPILFPGVELTASNGLHLLLLMDPACTQQHVEDLLSRVEVPVDNRGRDTARSSLSVEQILELCGDDALVVGAHVNGPDGLLLLDGQERLAVLRHRNLSAVEVVPEKDLDEIWLDGSKPEIGRRISQVHASDGHSVDVLGRRFTWVKMTRPNLEGLRLALLDGEASLQPDTRDEPGAPNNHAALALETITVHKGKFIGRDNPVTVGFNPWLNTIIGGRGTGKSTLVDFCRKTLRRETELDRSDRSEEGSLRDLFNRRMRVPPSRGDEGLLTAQTLIEVVYRKDGERFLLSWEEGGNAPAVARLDGDQRIPEEGDIRERFPIRIYSQKQLFALAQDPNALLTVIDDSRSVRGTEQSRAIDQLAERYLSLCAQARAAWAQARQLPARKALLEDVRRKLELLEKGGQALVLNKFRKQRQQDETWRAILGMSSQAVDAVKESVTELSVADLDLSAGVQENEPAETSLRSAHEALRRTVEDFRQDVIERVERAQQEIRQIETGTDSQQWRASVDAATREFERVSAQLAGAGIADPNQYGALLEQAAELGREIAALDHERERAEKLDQEATETLVAYRAQRHELSQRRQGFATGTSSESIQVEIVECGNCGNLAEDLSDILGIERFEGDRQEIARRIQPKEGDPWSWDRLDDVVSGIRQALAGGLRPWPVKDNRFATALERVPPERLDRLALYLPEDAIEVRFRDRSSGEWKPLTQGSPGQQTAALLAFVLGYGTEPILLDQPEDDLDNTLIYELLVSRLRETKTKRQVIIVTHNPNIVVHGDAELVLSLEARHGRSQITCQGGLQERAVREEICRVMEGGREAFESRYQRIMRQQGTRP